jgi:hypothetical protein
MDGKELVPKRVALADIDLDALAFLRSSMEGGFYDPADGEVYVMQMGQAITGDDDVDLDETDWIRVDGDDSRDGYLDMSEFADSVSDPVLSDRLVRALDGRGAFRRFRATVAEEGDDFREIWFTFSNARTQSRAIRWLLRNGLCHEPEADAAIEERNVDAEEALTLAGRWTRPAR